jgi:Flp pilus assembly protein TadG
MLRRTLTATAPSPQRTRRRGSVVVLGAVLMVVLVAFVAFAVDVGHVNMVRTQLQAAADSAALAGVGALNFGPAAAVNESEQFGEMNVSDNSAVSIVPGEDVALGRWNRNTLTFTAVPATQLQYGDAVRVTVRRVAARNNPVNHFFANVMGFSNVDMTATATAEARYGFCGPLVGLDSLTMRGNSYTDSYDSSNGSYSSQIPGDQGSVCSNGPITLNGIVQVNGHANPGPTSSVTLIGQAIVTGNTNPLPEEFTTEPTYVGDAATNNNNALIPPLPNGQSPLNANGDFVLNQGDITLPPGTYYFNDFRIAGNATVTVTDLTIIYVAGTMDLGGNAVANTSQIPSNLQLYPLGSTARLAGNGEFYGVIYAPETDVQIAGNTAVFGAVLGKTLQVDATGVVRGIHYDEQLGPLRGVRARAVLVE